MAYTLPPLPYAYDALEPYIDQKTMEIHHDKHHGAYVTNLNKALEGTGLGDEPVEVLIAHLDKVPEKVRTTVRNNGGGHANHSMFWKLMGKGKGASRPEKLAEAIDADIGRLRKIHRALHADRHGPLRQRLGLALYRQQDRQTRNRQHRQSG